MDNRVDAKYNKNKVSLMALKPLLIALILLLASPPTVFGYGLVSTQGNVTMRNPAYNITLLPTLNLTSMSSDSTTLTIGANASTFTLNSSTDFRLSNISYLNDNLNLTVNATTGTLNISAKMLNNNRLYYLFADGTKSTTYTSNSTGWTNFNWSSWSQHDLSIQPDVSVPALTAQSISPASVQQGYSSTVTANFTDDNSVSSAKVKIRNPDGSESNWTMTCTAGASVTCTKEYISTVILGVYSITNYFPKDNSNNEANITSSLTFEVTVMPQGGSGGGGGGGGGAYQPTPIPTPTANITTTPAPTQAPSITFKNITSGATQPESEIIAKCLKDSLVLENECSDINYGIVVEPVNWWTALGAFVFPFVVVGGIMLKTGKDRNLLPDVILYFLITIFVVAILVSAGLNMYIINYAADSSKYLYTFLSFGLWSSMVAGIGDYYGYRKYQKSILVWT